MTPYDIFFLIVFSLFAIQAIAQGVGWMKQRMIEKVRRDDALDELIYDE